MARTETARRQLTIDTLRRNGVSPEVLRASFSGRRARPARRAATVAGIPEPVAAAVADTAREGFGRGFRTGLGLAFSAVAVFSLALFLR